MKYVFLNFKSFVLHEKLVFFISVICIVSSAFIINFAYGLYYNYNAQKNETEYELKDLTPEIVEGETITKSEIRQYLESLSSDTLNAMYVICVQAELEEFPADSSGSFGAAYFRFVIRNGEYQVFEDIKETFEGTGSTGEKRLVSGRYITNSEEAAGKNVVILYSEPSNDYPEETKKIMTDENTVTLFGKDYEVIGVYNTGTHPQILCKPPK